MMKSPEKLLIVAKPGHFRDSLLAILRTLPRVEMFPFDHLKGIEWERSFVRQRTVLVFDLNAMADGDIVVLDDIRRERCGVRLVALADNIQQARRLDSKNVDFILSRNASAGELLSAVRQ